MAKRKIAFNQENSGDQQYRAPAPAMSNPPKTVRRNARERNRVKQIDVGFEKLRTTIPTAAQQKKISRVKILASAVDYIQHLHTLISEHETVCRHPGTSSLASQVKQETKTAPSAEQVLSWVDQVFHELRQNKVSLSPHIPTNKPPH